MFFSDLLCPLYAILEILSISFTVFATTEEVHQSLHCAHSRNTCQRSTTIHKQAHHTYFIYTPGKLFSFICKSLVAFGFLKEGLNN